MPSLSRIVDRVSRVGGRRAWLLALAGLAALWPSLRAIERLAVRPSAPGARAAAAPFAVANPAGKRIGTLAIDYPRRLRENQDGAIRVRYEAAPEWRAQFQAAASVAGSAAAGGTAPARSPLSLTVHLAATRLALEPKPASYTFDNARILAAGSDARSWILSPRQEGDYTLLLRLDAAPPGFRALRLSANGEPLAEAGEASLPVTVTTRYRIPQWLVDLARLAVSALAFLLTLPLAATLVKRFAGAGAKRRSRR